MVQFNGTHTQVGTGIQYSFVGEAVFAVDRVTWTASFATAGKAATSGKGVVQDVQIGSLTYDAAMQAAREYIDDALSA